MVAPVAVGIAQKRKDYVALMKELEAGQKEMETGNLSEARGLQLEAKAQEAEALQTELDTYDRRQKWLARGREVVDPLLPAPKEDEPLKKSRIAGYVGLGEFVTATKEYEHFASAGYPQSGSAPIRVEYLRKGLVPITKEQRELIEQKAIPTVGTGVIEAERISDVARVTEQDRIRLRDVINVSRTSASAITYLRIDSYTSAAAPVAPTVLKPESTLAMSVQTANVRVLAVWMPVTTQQLADVPDLQNLIDNELTYDLRRVEETQMLYGIGTGEHLKGITKEAIVNIAGLARYAGGDSIIDKIRYGVTEVTANGYEPNAVVMHPRDWEAVLLKKGTDNHYVWAVVTDENGSRIWGLSVVETVAADNVSSDTTEERNIVVGDFKRGATLWIREDISVQVGLQGTQFVTNQRTILAEERVAFAVKRLGAFAKLITVVAVP